MKKFKKAFIISISFILAFVLWTVALRFIDVQSVGPSNTSVGFATLNTFIHQVTGVHMSLYTITDWLGLVPLGTSIGFAFLGLLQWIRRKSLFKVDYNIFLLGAFYIIVFTLYILFEIFIVNYRPILINGYLEASYPSSTTMLVMCVMPTAMIQFGKRIKRKSHRQCINSVICAFIVFMVTARLLSGVHWFTDIIGGALLSAGLVTMYYSFVGLNKERKPLKEKK